MRALETLHGLSESGFDHPAQIPIVYLIAHIEGQLRADRLSIVLPNAIACPRNHEALAGIVLAWRRAGISVFRRHWRRRG